MKALFTFLYLSRAALAAFGQNVVTMMTGNAFFPTPAVPLATLGAAVDLLIAKNAAAVNGSQLQRLEAKNAATALNNLLRTQANYVTVIAQGDAAIILSAGFVPSKTRSPNAIPDKPIGVTVKRTSIIGNLSVKLKRSARAKFYVLFTSTDPNLSIVFLTGSGRFNLPSNVSQQISTRAAFDVSFLPSNITSYFIIYAVNTAGFSPVSDVVSEVAK